MSILSILINTVFAQGLVPDCLPEECDWEDFGELLRNLLSFGLRIVIPIAGLVIAYGGFLYLTAAGNEKKIKAGTAAIIGAIWGVVIVYGSYLIITLVLRTLTGG